MLKYGFILELSYEMANTVNSGSILLNKMEVGSENVFGYLVSLTSVQHGVLKISFT